MASIVARVALAVFVWAALTTGGSPPARAETIKFGVLKTTASGPVFIANDKGYFAAEGLAAEIVYFDSAQPIAVATASGGIDFGWTGLTGGFYGLASQGTLTIVAGGARETPGFPYEPFLVSNRAWDAGLRSFKDFPGHTFAVSQFGSPPHYALRLLAEKYGFDLKDMRLLPLQSIPNMVAAISSGQTDTTMVSGNAGVPLIQHGDAKLMGYAGDETPFQLSAMLASRKTADERHDTIERALRAIRKGAADYYAAFTPHGKREDGPSEPAIIAIIAKDASQSVEEAHTAVPFIDPEVRLDVADVLRQLDWYKAQGLVKGEAGGDRIIDRRYVLDLQQK